MKTCKDCIHSDICKQFEVCVKGIGFDFTNTYSPCEHFKDKDLFVELPVPLGADVYELNWDYTDDDFSCNEIWYIEKVPFTMWRLDYWGEYVFETEKEALEQLEEKRR
jgi:hypothetical protein